MRPNLERDVLARRQRHRLSRRRLALEMLERRNPPGSMLAMLPHEALPGIPGEATDLQSLLQQRRRLLGGQSLAGRDPSVYAHLGVQDLGRDSVSPRWGGVYPM